MYAEHSVEYDKGHPGRTRTVTREIFDTPDGRVCGTETERVSRYVSQYEGWTWYEKVLGTHHFADLGEAKAWIDDMFREHELAHVSSGPRCVIV